MAKEREWVTALKIQLKHQRAMHEELGKFYDIPDCCVRQFCDENERGILSAQYRQQKHGKFINPIIGYVPCDVCMMRLK